MTHSRGYYWVTRLLIIWWRWIGALVLLVGMLGGCATPPEAMTVVADPAGAAESWWYVRFRLTWPEGEEPLWWPDLLLADQVVRPVLDAERATISLWRFHRRAARDEAGRQFSFIFRATPATAARVNAWIAADLLVVRLQGEGLVRMVVYEDPITVRRLGVGDTSDKSWSPEMQAAWPWFIMGVSRLWLELIREIGKREGLPKELKARYAAIEQVLNERWRDEGGHALLHHLSAVFGYQELAVTRRELMRF